MNAIENTEAPFEVGYGAQIKGRVTRAHEALDQLLEPEYRRLGLSAGEADVLTILLLTREPLAPTDLANWLGLTTAGMTGRLNTLETQELIERRTHPEDGRRRTLHFTDAGLEMARTVLRLKDEVVERHVVAALGAAGAESLLRHLDAVIASAQPERKDKPA